MRVAIFIQGGTVHDIISDGVLEVVVIDRDTEGDDDDDIRTVLGDDAYVEERTAHSNRATLQRIWNESI